MKKILVFVLAAFIALNAPWRLMGLGAEMFMLHPGEPRFPATSAHYWDVEALENRLMGLGWGVRYANGITMYGQEAYGITSPHEHVIAVDAALAWDARFAILAHEAGHTQQPYWVSTVEGDCFAESVAALVARDGLREHARYLAPRKWTCVMLMVAEWQAIYHAAATLKD